MCGPWVYMYIVTVLQNMQFSMWEWKGYTPGQKEALWEYKQYNAMSLARAQIQTAIKGIINIKVTCQHVLTACGCW